MQRPVVALRERVAVVVVRVVDPTARILVLVPGAADLGVLLEDDDVDAGLREPVRGEQPGHARADDRDAEVGVGRDVGLAPLRCAPVVAAERELLLEQRQVVGQLGAADDVRGDPQQVVARGRGRDRDARRRGTARARRARGRVRWPAARRSCPLAGAPMRIGSGRRSSRSSERSPVTYASAGRSGGTSASAERGADLVVGRGDRVHGRRRSHVPDRAPAVDDDLGAGDEARVGAEQEPRGRADLRRVDRPGSSATRRRSGRTGRRCRGASGWR